MTVPSELAPEVEESLASSIPWHRESVIAELERVLRGTHPGRALAARLALERLCDDDSRQVATHALAVLSTVPRQRAAPEPAPVREQDPLTDFVPVPARDEPEAPVQPQVREPVPAEPEAPEPEALQPVPAEPGAREPGAREPGARRRTLAAPRTARPRRWWPVAAVALLVVVAAGAWWAFSGRGDDSGRATTKAARLPGHVLVISSRTGDVRHLLEIDTDTGRAVRGAPTPVGRLPSVSPLRDEVVFIGGRAANTGVGNQAWTPYVVGADLAHPRPLLPASVRPPECTNAARAAWKPGRSGLLVLPCKDAANKTTGLQVVTATGRLVGHERLLPGISGDPTWTGDGHVVFAQVVDDRTRLFELPDDLTGQPRPLFHPTDPSVSDSAPDWSEQGLLFLRSHSDAAGVSLTAGTVMLSVDGRKPVAVHEVLSHVVGPTWSPDGSDIAFLEPSGEQGVATLRLFDRQHGTAVDTSVSGSIGAPAWGSR